MTSKAFRVVRFCGDCTEVWYAPGHTACVCLVCDSVNVEEEKVGKKAE
jgi:hypothetical protein